MTHVDFRKSAPQPYRDWGGDHIAIFRGHCARCGQRTYEPNDQHGDPRGVLGMRLTVILRAATYGMHGPDIVFCWDCAENDGETARKSFRIACGYWTKEG